jgi:hypothetical protein
MINYHYYYNKARFDLNNLPWSKFKFLGVKITVNPSSHKENNTITLLNNHVRMEDLD